MNFIQREKEDQEKKSINIPLEFSVFIRIKRKKK